MLNRHAVWVFGWYLGTRASGPHVEAARRLELRLPPAATGVRGPPARMRKRHAVWSFGYRPLPPGYAGLRPACGSSTPSGASDAARCPWGTRASGPHVEAARRLGLRLPPVVTGVRGPPARMLKRHAVWVFGWYLGTWASGPHVKAARRLGLRLVPGYASLRPACGSSAPSGASAAACCHRGTRASGPYVKAARRLGLRLVPGYVGLRPACAVYGGDFLHPLVAAGARE